MAYMRQGWTTEDWDFDYLIYDIEFKIKRMQGYFRTSNVLDQGSIDIMQGQMQEILDLFKKIQEDEYYTGWYLLPESEKAEFLNKKQDEANADWIKVWKLMGEYLHNFWD